MNLVTFLLGAGAALLIGFSKTGMPGAAIPAVALMAEAFRENTRLSIGAMLPVLLLGDLFALAYYRRHANWDRLQELFPYVAIGMIPGYLVLWLVESDPLRVLIGAIILGLLGLQIARQRFGWEKMPDRRWFIATTGVLAGFGTAVGNAAGPVMSIYLISKRMDKQEFLGTAAWFFFIVNMSKIPFFLGLGMITPATLSLDALLVPVVVVGAIVGVLVLKRIPQAVFNAIVLSLAGVAAVRMVFW
ncbi:MAG: sulfite exporter TauE/SafE family protein [Planctomycetes bacterium]|nr:sulfite exporter TauE/SafE family protein [Planctomycetota bacterium]